MKYCTVAIIVLAFSVAGFADELDNWLSAPEYRGNRGVRVGADDDSGNIRGIDGQVVLPFYNVLTAEYFQSSQSSDDEQDFDHYFIELSSDPVGTWSTALGYEYSGNNQVLEADHIIWSVQYYPSYWSLNIAYLYGEVTAFVRPEFSHLDNTSSTIDQRGYDIGIDIDAGAWSWQLHGRSLHYSEDLSAVRNSRTLRRLVSQQTLSNIFNLIDWRVYSSIGYSWEKTVVRMGITRYQLAVESTQASNLTAISTTRLAMPSISQRR